MVGFYGKMGMLYIRSEAANGPNYSQALQFRRRVVPFRWFKAPTNKTDVCHHGIFFLD